MNDWAVYRQDYTGVEYLVEKGLTEQRARELVEEYESHKHHQHYWADKQPAETPDFTALLSKMLADGSSLHLALPVLITSGATNMDCLEAVQNACNYPPEAGEELIRRFSKTKRHLSFNRAQTSQWSHRRCGPRTPQL